MPMKDILALDKKMTDLEFYEYLRDQYPDGRPMDEARSLPKGTRLLCYCVAGDDKGFDFGWWHPLSENAGYWRTVNPRWRPVLWWPLPKTGEIEL